MCLCGGSAGASTGGAPRTSWSGGRLYPDTEKLMYTAGGYGVRKRLYSDMLVSNQAPKNMPQQRNLKVRPGWVRRAGHPILADPPQPSSWTLVGCKPLLSCQLPWARFPSGASCFISGPQWPGRPRHGECPGSSWDHQLANPFPKSVELHGVAGVPL